jgi:hypothetical protein
LGKSLEKHEWPRQEIQAERIFLLCTKNGIKMNDPHLLQKKFCFSMEALWQDNLHPQTMFHYRNTICDPWTVVGKKKKKHGLGFPQQQEWFIREVSDKYLHEVGVW